jgi:hypothetical protein
MKRALLFCLILLGALAGHSQTVYYWVGGTVATTGANITTAANWNTALNGSGTTRPSSTGATDILVFDGTNIGGATPTTGQALVNINGGVTCGQLKFQNGANVAFTRTSTTGTINVSGGAGEDFTIEAGSSLLFTTNGGSVVIALAATCTGSVSGNFSMITNQQARIANTTGGTPGSLVFKAGSKFTTNITSTSSSYPFGSSTQSSEMWVVFEAGSHLYYEGGYTPMGSAPSGTFFMPIDFRPGSYFHMKASNPAGASGTFFNRKAYANIIVENGATLTSDGTFNRIDTLQILPGSSFVTHTSGQTVVLGNLEVNGVFQAPAGSTNELQLAGTVPQTVSGVGTINAGSLLVSTGADVTLATNVAVANAATVYGKLNFGTYTITGAGSFSARGPLSAITGAVNTTAGSYILKGASAITGLSRGLAVTGAGIAPGSHISSITTTGDTVYLSQPMTATATGTSVGFSSTGAHLITSSAGGFDVITGSVTATGSRSFQDGISYTFNAATSTPFGTSTASTATSVNLNNVTFNAAATTNISAYISGTLTVAAPVTIRPGEQIRLATGATLAGTFSPSVYFITAANAAGDQGLLRRDGITGATLFPVGSATNYLPVTLNPATASDFTVATFEGITANGLPNGTPLTLQERQTLVNAVWNINRLSGSGNADVKLDWVTALEGSVFTTFADTEIGTITNNGTSWSAPIGTGNNTTNTITNSFSSFGAFGVGARPPANPFLFNAIPPKTYGTADFTAGVLTSNTTTPVVYTSSNPAVATVNSSGQIHIVGVGSTTIRATQASDGFYPAADVSQVLLVNKAPLTIRANDVTRPEGDPNPAFTVSYTGFVNGENESVLTTAPTTGTAATAASAVGTYPITVSGATAVNYVITMVSGTLTVSPRAAQTITFTTIPAKTYGNPDFAVGVSSSNVTIPVTLASSNPAVATIVGNNIHIVGAGTANITASQVGNAFFFPAAPVSRTLTVSKANLTFRAFDTSRLQGDPNPTFRTTATGFVLGETIASLPTAPVATSGATATSAPGYYPITFSPGVSSNYNFLFTEARLSVLPATGSSQDHIQAYMINGNILRVRVYSTKPDLADILVFDISGRPVAIRNLFLPQGFGTAHISLNGMAPGIYVVRVRGKETDLTQKVLVGHP